MNGVALVFIDFDLVVHGLCWSLVLFAENSTSKLLDLSDLVFKAKDWPVSAYFFAISLWETSFFASFSM